MYDLIKVIASNLLMPIPILLALIVLTFLLIIFNYKKTAALVSFTSLAALFLFSWSPFTDHLINTYERQYPAFIDQNIDSPAAVVVLGAGWYPKDKLSTINMLSESSLGRLIEGIRIANKYPNAKLVVSGANRDPSVSPMALGYAKAAIELGFDTERIVVLDKPTDTGKEAVAYHLWAKQNGLTDQAIILVTSASHMPRSMRHFEAEGINAIAAPAHYLAHPEVHDFAYWVPSVKNLQKTHRFWYEYLASFAVNLEH